jgi:Fur family peroxide stress response transcriptional regulator
MVGMRKLARNTKQREVIWRAIKNDKSHPTADQIYDKVRKQLPNISLGTVYRNLQKLIAEERVQVLMLGRSQRFDPLAEQHQHFICQTCDRVYDVFVATQKELKPRQLPHEGFKVTSHHLAFYGTCKYCSS